MISRFLRLCMTLFVLMVTLAGCAEDIIGRYRNEGSSMLPTLSDGEYFFSDNLAYATQQPQRGDIVLFNRSGGRQYIKRVIGLPGETIEIRDGKVWINGAALDEPYVTQLMRSGLSPRQIEPDRYFVLGDNRNNSSDSRSFGTVDITDIVGRATSVYYSLTQMRVITRPTYTLP